MSEDLIGQSYVVVVSYPDGFHEIFAISRFCGVIQSVHDNCWMMTLKHPLRQKQRKFSMIAIYPKDITVALQPETSDNAILGKLIEEHGGEGEWFVGVVAPDKKDYPTLALWPFFSKILNKYRVK